MKPGIDVIKFRGNRRIYGLRKYALWYARNSRGRFVTLNQDRLTENDWLFIYVLFV